MRCLRPFTRRGPISPLLPAVLLALGALATGACGDDDAGGADAARLDGPADTPDGPAGAPDGALDGPGVPDAQVGPDAPVLGQVIWSYPHQLQAEFGPAIGPGGEIVLQGKRSIEAGDTDPTVLAFASDGTLLWGADTSPATVPAPPVTIHDGLVLAPASTPGGDLIGNVFRFQLADGTPLAPLVLDGPVGDALAVGADGTLFVPSTAQFAFSAAGTELWRAPMVGTGKTGTNAAVGPSGTVYVGGRGLDDHRLHALDPTSGSELWSLDLGGALIDPIAIDDEGRVYAMANDTLHVVTAAGAVDWEFPIPDGGGSGGGIVLDEHGVVYFGSLGTITNMYDDWMFAVRETAAGGAGEIVWRANVGFFVTTTPALTAGGTLYVSNSCREFFALDAATGVERWRFESPGTTPGTCADFSAPSVGPDGTVYVSTEGPVGEAGGLYALVGDGTGLSAASPWPGEQADAAHRGRVTAP